MLLKDNEAVIHAFERSAFTFKKLQDNMKDTEVLLYNFGFGDEC